MMMSVLPYITPVLTGVVGWLGGQRKKRNDFLGDLQESIDMLVEKNKELYGEVIQLRTENKELYGEVSQLRLENKELRADLDNLTEYIKARKLPLPERRKRNTK